MNTAARPPANAQEEYEIRRLSTARNVPRVLWQRAQIIAMSWAGADVADISVEVGLHPKTVREWTQRFSREGLRGLTDRPRPGRPRVVPEHKRAWLVELASHPPAVNGSGSAPTWTLSRLVEVAAGAGVRISRSQLRRILNDAGVAWDRPRAAEPVKRPARTTLEPEMITVQRSRINGTAPRSTARNI